MRQGLANKAKLFFLYGCDYFGTNKFLIDELVHERKELLNISRSIVYYLDS